MQPETGLQECLVQGGCTVCHDDARPICQAHIGVHVVTREAMARDREKNGKPPSLRVGFSWRKPDAVRLVVRTLRQTKSFSERP